jgi:hypothetical protein
VIGTDVERRCLCGQPLHYSDPRVQAAVEHLVEQLGEDVSVVTADGVYRVSRHYIALHEVRGRDLEDLVRAGMAERVAE